MQHTIPPLTLHIAPLTQPIEKRVVLSADAAMVMDVESGAILYKKNIHKKRPIASLTKLMTALLTVERTRDDDVVRVSQRAYAAPGSQMHLLANERVYAKNLLMGLLIRSANDAAIALAEHISGTEEAFVVEMNRKARQMGLFDTQYKNAHGLDAEGAYSSAFDVTLLAKRLIANAKVREIVRQKEATITDVNKKIIHKVQTTNWLLSSPFPVYGVKTGTTEKAGQCFVALVKVRGREYLITVLGSTRRFSDTKALLWALMEGG